MENNFSNNSGAYLRTTENINGYYDQLDFKDKTVLTAVGASDHIFEAILRGAKEVDGFDISENALLFYYLKEAAIKSLDFEDYINFFFVENLCFSREKYEFVRTNLNQEALQYWDRIFHNDKLEPIEIIQNLLVSKPAFYLSALAAENKLSLLSSYLSKVEFEKLKVLINEVKVNVKLRDVFDLSDIDKQYDYIILSNIFEYHDVEKFKQLIEEYRRYLSQDGIIVVGYAYHDIDLSKYSEYDTVSVPSRYMLLGSPGAPDDHIIKTGKK